MQPGFLTILATGMPLVAAQFEGKSTVFSSAYTLDDQGLRGLQGTGYTLSKWAWGTIPQKCYNMVVNNNSPQLCNPYDVEVYEATYTDCPTPWVLCRCNNSPMSIDKFATALGKMPVRSRQHSRFWASVAPPTNWPYAAWTDATDVTVFGDYSNQPSMWVHELGHNLDVRVAGKGTAYYSESAEWRSILDKDSCVPDTYSKNNVHENFATVTVTTTFDANIRPFLSTFSAWCMSNQYGKNIELLWNSIHYDAGATCTSRITGSDSQRICMGPAARDSGNCNGVAREMSVMAPNVTAASTEFPADLQKKIDDAMAEKQRKAFEAWAGISAGEATPLP